jgi:hypothetical protein
MVMRIVVPESAKPWLRAARFGWLRWRAERAASRAGPDDRVPDPAPVAFLIGCGRSGTTALGRVLARHPDVSYLFEPYHAWAAVDRATDCANLYHRVGGRALMDASLATPAAQARFGRLMLGARRRSGRRLLIEKTPVNTLRIGYVGALAPGAKFVHLVRDGADVCRSIDRLASSNTYRIAGKPTLNQWWGADGAKWAALRRDGSAAGYFPSEVGRLRTHLARGAYEWLVSLSEVDAWRAKLDERLLDLRYPDLAADPTRQLQRLCRFLDLSSPVPWLERASREIGPAARSEGKPLVLPPSMCSAFNAFQERYGFANRAVPAPDDH